MTNTTAFFSPSSSLEARHDSFSNRPAQWFENFAVDVTLSLRLDPDELATVFRTRKAIARSIQFYGARLAKMDPVSFNYQNEHQRKAIEEELLHTFYLLYDDCQLHLLEGNETLLLQRRKQLERCGKMLSRLRTAPPLGEHVSIPQRLADQLDGSPDKPAKYIGLTELASLIANTILSFSVTQALEWTQKTISAANAHRLNWVWSGGLALALLNLIPDWVGKTEQARDAFAKISPVTGYMSFIFHFTQLGIELSLLTKGTLKGSWITGADKTVSVGLWERFTTQLDMRKFSILNYGLWGPANMACFFILVGNGTLGWMGNGLTGVMLLVDLTLAYRSYNEKKAEYKHVLKQCHVDILDLEDKIITLDGELQSLEIEIKAVEENILCYPEKKEDLEYLLPHKEYLLSQKNDLFSQKEVLAYHKTALDSAKAKWTLDWKFDNEKMTRDMMYAAALFASVAIMCCFFFPPAAMVPATLLILGVVGSALSFLATLIYNIDKNNIEYKQWQRLSEDTQNKKADLENKKAVLEAKMPSSPNEKALVQNALAHLNTELAYQQNMVEYHRTQGMRQAFIQAMIPASAFGLLVFANVGLAIVLPVAALLILSSEYLNRQKPAAPDSPGFNDENTPLSNNISMVAR